MATFSASIDASDLGSVSVFARFTGGDSDYVGHRRIHIAMTGDIDSQTADFESAEPQGADGTFSGTIDGLHGGLYRWFVTLQYWDGANWVDSAYTSTGTVLLPRAAAWVYHAGAWHPAKIWVYHAGAWHPAAPWIYHGGW